MAMMDDRSLRAERLAEFVSLLTGADQADSVDATGGRAPGPGGPDSLEIVAHAILELRESERALRVTPYLDCTFEPVIDLRTATAGADHDDDLRAVDLRFRRHERDVGGTPRRVGGRSTGTSPSGFVPA
jgi:hypothetical protein